MSCCDETTARVPNTDLSRRSVLKGAVLIATVIPAVRPTQSTAQSKQIKLAYCSQLLCGVPYEVARAGGYFKKHGLDVELVYTRGGSAAMQALVDAGLVQEPALTVLSRSGARVLVNAMDSVDAQKYLGGTYEFMGVAVRAKELAQRKPEMVQLSQALGDALKALHTMSGDELVGALPREMTTGLDLKEFGGILGRYRDSLYPDVANIDLDAAKRVAHSLIVGGLLNPDGNLSGLHHRTTVGR